MSDSVKSKSALLRLCTNAVLIALVVVFDMLSIRLGNDYKITFGGIPIILCAIIYGPIDAAAVGLLGSFIGQLFTFGVDITTPLWIMPAAVRGLVMGLLFIAFKKSTNVFVLSFEIIVSSIMVSLANTLAMYIVFLITTAQTDPSATYTFVFITFIMRIVMGIVSAVIYSAIVQVILLAIKKVGKKQTT